MLYLTHSSRLKWITLFMGLYLSLISCQGASNTSFSMKQEAPKHPKQSQNVVQPRYTANKPIKPWQLLLTTLAGLVVPTHSHYYGDKGLIGYFEGDCPEGWGLYQPLTGRVPVGVGNYIGTAEDGRTEAKIYYLNNTGGEIEHNLTTSEIPKHDHSNGDYKQLLKSDCYATTDSIDVNCGEPNILASGALLTVGKDQPHNNMQPYLVLSPCQKMVSFDYVDQNDFLALKQEVLTLKQQLKRYELQASSEFKTKG